jgi:uncharacterized protein DUF2505
MRFSLEHRFDAPVDVVVKIANSEDFQAALEVLPNLGERRVTEVTQEPDGTIHRVTRYKLGAQLPAPVVAVLGQTATWDEVADFDPQANRWTFEIRPHVLKGRLQCRGSYAFASDDNGTTTRTVDVDLKVKVPLVGGRAEREIKKGLVETMEAEAKLLAEHLEGR